MLPKTHIILGLFFSLLLVLLFDVPVYGGVVVFLVSFLVDVDHYFYGVFKKRTFSLSKIHSYFLDKRKKWRALSYDMKCKTKFPILLFHGFEFVLFLFVLSFFSVWFLFVLLGVSFHLLLDYVDIFVNKDPVFTKLSVVYVWFTNCSKKEL
jgi:hypothetical protein